MSRECPKSYPKQMPICRKSNTRDRIRTCDLRFRNRAGSTLYPPTTPSGACPGAVLGRSFP
jgi:hypothetical protein